MGKQDPKLVASKDGDEHEVKYIASRFKIPVKIVRKACKSAGRSRKKVYAWLRAAGWPVKTKAFSNG